LLRRWLLLLLLPDDDTLPDAIVLLPGVGVVKLPDAMLQDDGALNMEMDETRCNKS
jgi:hypothetical protein